MEVAFNCSSLLLFSPQASSKRLPLESTGSSGLAHLSQVVMLEFTEAGAGGGNKASTEEEEKKGCNYFG